MLSDTQLDGMARGRLPCSVHQEKVVDLTYDFKAERHKSYNVKHTAKIYNLVDPNILNHLGMNHFSPPVFELISKQVLITPGHFSVFSTFPSENEKKTREKTQGYLMWICLKIGPLNIQSITSLSLFK